MEVILNGKSIKSQEIIDKTRLKNGEPMIIRWNAKPDQFYTLIIYHPDGNDNFYLDMLIVNIPGNDIPLGQQLVQVSDLKPEVSNLYIIEIWKQKPGKNDIISKIITQRQNYPVRGYRENSLLFEPYSYFEINFGPPSTELMRSPRRLCVSQYGSCPRENECPRGECQCPRGEYYSPRRSPRGEYYSPQGRYYSPRSSPRRYPRGEYCSPRSCPRGEYYSPRSCPREGYRSPRRQSQDKACPVGKNDTACSCLSNNEPTPKKSIKIEPVNSKIVPLTSSCPVSKSSDHLGPLGVGLIAGGLGAGVGYLGGRASAKASAKKGDHASPENDMPEGYVPLPPLNFTNDKGDHAGLLTGAILGGGLVAAGALGAHEIGKEKRERQKTENKSR